MEKKKPSIDEIIKANVDFAKKTFELQGDVKPMFIVHSPDGFIPILALFNGEQQKAAVLKLVSYMIIRHRGYAYSIVHEAWMKSISVEEAKTHNGRLEQDPEKKEALIISYVGYDRNEMVSLEITRKDGKATLGEPVKFSDGGEGRFYELLPPPHIAETMNKEKDAALDMVIALTCVRAGLSLPQTIEMKAP